MGGRVMLAGLMFLVGVFVGGVGVELLHFAREVSRMGRGLDE